MSSRESITDQLRPWARRPGNVPRQFSVVKVMADLTGDDLDRAAESARNEALKWIQKRSGPLSKQAWRGEDFENPVPGVGSSGVRFRSDNADFWAGRLDYADEKTAGQTWTTEIIIAHEIQKSVAHFGLQLNVATREQYADITPSVPGVVRQVIDAVGLSRNGRPVNDKATLVASVEDFDKFARLIRDPLRRRPVHVISLDENETDPGSAVVDANKLARLTVGLAHVCVLTGEASFWLSDDIGKNLSVFMRAVRTYQPSFDPDEDEPHDHPLALPDRIANWQNKGADAFINQLVRSAAKESLRRADPVRGVPSFTEIKNAALSLRRREIEQRADSAVDAELFDLTKLELDEQKREVSEWKSLAEGEEQIRLTLESQCGQLRSQNLFLRERVRQLEKSIEERGGGNADSLIEIPDTLNEVKRWAEQYLPGLIQITPRAYRAAKGGIYQDVKLVYECLTMLAREYRDSRIYGGAEPFQQKLQRLGVEISRSFAGGNAGKFGDTYFVNHNGRDYTLEWHVKKGNDRDQRNCLRIYFSWDEDDQMVVVGSLPAHLKNNVS